MIGQGTRLMVAVAIAAMLGVPVAAAKDPLEVGMAVALTGYLANFDGQYIDGVKVAVKLANAKPAASTGIRSICTSSTTPRTPPPA